MNKTIILKLLTLHLLIFAAPLYGIETFKLSSLDKTTSAIGVGLEYLKDDSHQLSVQQAMAEKRTWMVNDALVFNQGYSDATWWIRFSLENKNDPVNYILKIAYPVLDYVDIFFVNNEEIVKHIPMGDKLPFHSRPIKHRLFMLPLPMKADETITVYIKVRSTSSIQVPLEIVVDQDFYIDDITESVLHGIFMGGISSIAIYNLLIFFVLRDKTYLYYVCYVLSMFFFLTSLNGWSFQYLWPNSTLWNDTAILMSLNGVVIFSIAFGRRFLQLDKLGKNLVRSAQMWTVLCLVCFVIFFFAPYSIGIRIVIPFAAIACLWALSTGVYAWKKGQQSAGIYVLAWSGLWLGGIILALNKMHIMPRNFFTDYGVQMGSFLEVLLLSFALAERINQERSLRIIAQNQALVTQKRANEQLEERVDERTKELEALNAKLQEISDTDQLTQLKNRRYLDDYIDAKFKLAQKEKHPFSILLIDVDHFKKVNDQYGHLVGDDCLKAIARRIKYEMHWPKDVAARYGGEEFCIVMPETDIAGATIVARRIRESIAERVIVTSTADLNITVSIGVSTLIPGTNNTTNEVIDYADKALYLAKDMGRNRIEISPLN